MTTTDRFGLPCEKPSIRADRAAHAARLVPGVRVRVYRASDAFFGLMGTVEGRDQALIVVRTDGGLRL